MINYKYPEKEKDLLVMELKKRVDLGQLKQPKEEVEEG